MVPEDDMSITERSGQSRLSGSKDRYHGYAKQRSQVHGAGIVGKHQSALLQFVDKLIQCRMPDPIDAMIPDRGRNLIACCRVISGSKHNPVRRTFSAHFRRDLSESLRKPSFGRSIFRAWGKANQGLMFDVGCEFGAAFDVRCSMFEVSAPHSRAIRRNRREWCSGERGFRGPETI